MLSDECDHARKSTIMQSLCQASASLSKGMLNVPSYHSQRYYPRSMMIALSTKSPREVGTDPHLGGIFHVSGLSPFPKESLVDTVAGVRGNLELVEIDSIVVDDVLSGVLVLYSHECWAVAWQ